jgi:aspartate aminotransferase-like enzyme
MSAGKPLIMLPGPTNVPERVMNALSRSIISHRGREFESLYESIVENAKYVYQTQNDVFPLTVSGTGGVECAVSNLIEKGDKVLVPVYGDFSNRIKDKISVYGGVPIEISLEWGEVPTPQQIREAIEKEGNIKVVFIVYNETSTGATVRNLPEISRIVKEHGALVAVDAISILGGDQLPVDEWRIDVCVVGSQKCLACPPGVALISVSSDAWKKIEQKSARPFYFDLIRARKFSEKNQTPFTPALPIFFALEEALKMIKEEGLEQRFKRHFLCAKAFYAAAEALSLEPFPIKKARSNTVIALKKPEGISVADIRETMATRYGVLVAGGMGKIKELILRIGCMGIISQREVLTTVFALGNALKDLGFKVDVDAGVEVAKNIFSEKL